MARTEAHSDGKPGTAPATNGGTAEKKTRTRKPSAPRDVYVVAQMVNDGHAVPIDGKLEIILVTGSSHDVLMAQKDNPHSVWAYGQLKPSPRAA